MTEPQQGTTLEKLAPGDIIAIETSAGRRHVQVTHIRAPYPDVVRAITPAANTSTPDEIAKGDTAFSAMVELGKALRDDAVKTTVIGRADVPAAARPFPLFRLPIRNRAGEIVYWWHWDGEGLTVAPDAGDSDLPIREVLPVAQLEARLSDLSA
jgi:hypothetical protein